MDIKGHTVTLSVQNKCVGQAASRRLEQMAEYAQQGISVSSTLIFSHLEHACQFDFQKISVIFFW